MKNPNPGAVALLMVSSLVLSSCLKGLFGGGGENAAFDGCPEDVQQVERLSWEMEQPQELEIKSGLLAALSIDRLAGSAAEELNEACGDLARQLFVDEKSLEPEEFSVGAEASLACARVDEALGKLKGIAGGRVTVTAAVPLCSTPMSAAQDCLAACRVMPKKKKDQKKMAPVAEPECEGELSGLCDGNCNGQCTIEDDSECTSRCAGLCQGSCDSEFTGECRGKCEGTCDGEPSPGECQGTCQGRCLEAGRGTCGGTCMGSCEGACTMQAAGRCEGTCTGECDKSLSKQRCTGYLRLPETASGSCESSCDALIMAEMKCLPPVVKVQVADFENEEAAGLIERSLSQHLPKILAAKALNLEQDRLDKAAAHAKDVSRKMLTAAQSVSTLTDKNKVCLREAENIAQASSAALPTLLDAGIVARSATAGD